MNRSLWQRVCGIAPASAWAVAGFAQVAIALPFWLYSTPGPFYEVHGDLYRGWPLIYGLDQGDVIGDDWGPWIAYFRPAQFALDTIVAVACALPLTGLIVWVGRRTRQSLVNSESRMSRAAREAPESELGAKPDLAVTRFPWGYFVATLLPAGLFGAIFALPAIFGSRNSMGPAMACLQLSGPVGAVVLGWGLVRLWRGDAKTFPALRWLMWLPGMIGVAGVALGG